MSFVEMLGLIWAWVIAPSLILCSIFTAGAGYEEAQKRQEGSLKTAVRTVLGAMLGSFFIPCFIVRAQAEFGWLWKYRNWKPDSIRLLELLENAQNEMTIAQMSAAWSGALPVLRIRLLIPILLDSGFIVVRRTGLINGILTRYFVANSDWRKKAPAAGQSPIGFRGIAIALVR